ncbi:MAG: protein kinase [Alphaproteobacteria bacterium]|nr:protein kinase [Alphaproteobacteria bacterium]
MAAVLEVEHVDTGDVRALKLMLPVARSGEVARRMEREFLALSRLDHDSVLKVYEAGLFDGRPWFVTEKLVGQELKVAVEAWRALAPAERFRRAEAVLTQVAQALAYIHDQGLVHRDVTPSNIMLLDDGSLRLMDFGVIKEPGADLTHVGEVVGTVAYIAPEQITGGAVDARADLYALGAVLYLMLTGRRPFNARNLAGYLDKHLNRDPRPPRELAPTLPERLDEICLRLLAKRPEDRFASARHLLLALHDEPLPGASLPGASLPEASPTGPDRLDDNSEQRLVATGRASELALVRDAVTRLISPERDRATAMTDPGERRAPPRPPGGVVVIHGGDGMGKSRMAAEAMGLARRLGVGVTRIRGNGDPRPWSGVRHLIEALEGLPGFTVPPALRDALAGGARANAWAVHAAVRELVVATGPRLTVIDDAHRVDRASLALISHLLRSLVVEARFPLLLVLTRDPEEAPGGAVDMLLEQDHDSVTPLVIELQPLEPAAVEEMLLHHVVDDEAARALARRLAQDGEGNPFFIAQMVRGLFERGVIAPGEAGHRGRVTLDASELEMATLPVPHSIRDALEEGLSRVGADARAALDVLAIARTPLSDDVIGEASDLGHGARLAAALEDARRAGLVTRPDGGAGKHVLDRHRLADVLADAMADDARRALHGRLARALEAAHRRDPGPVVATVAEHFAAAGYAAVAWPYLLDAARQQYARGYVHESLELLDKGLHIEPRARGFAPLPLAETRLSEALQLRAAGLVHVGRWEEARLEARRSLALARELGDALRMAAAAAELGALGRRRHDLEDAEQWLTAALEHARRAASEGAPVDQARAARILPLYELGGVAWARGELDGADAHWREALHLAEVLADERAQALGANGLGVLALCRGDAAEARRHFARAEKLCTKHSMAERLVIARINLIELHHMTGNLRMGGELADRTVAEARAVGHTYGVALGLRYRALVLADVGRLADARENADEAADMQRALQNPEEELSALVMAARTALYDADPDAAWDALDEAAPLLAEHDTEGFAPVVAAWRARILAARGEREAARAALERARAEGGRHWPHQRIRMLLNVARAEEDLGEAHAAAVMAEEALRLADASGYRLYAMRARQIAARTVADEAGRARHQRVAEALARSLAANLPREDAEGFMARQPSLR